MALDGVRFGVLMLYRRVVGCTVRSILSPPVVFLNACTQLQRRRTLPSVQDILFHRPVACSLTVTVSSEGNDEHFLLHGIPNG